MNATTFAEPLLFMLLAVVEKAQILRHEVSVLDLPPDDVLYFQNALTGIQEQATRFIALCVEPLQDH